MCYIQLSLRLDNKKINCDIDELIRNIAIDEIDGNKDGSFIKSRGIELRSMDKSEIVSAIYEADTNGLLLHHRFATAGLASLKNVHGWTNGKWQLVHNGWVTGVGSHTNHKKSDTLLFYERLMAKVNKVKTDKAIANAINKIAQQTDFSGRAILLDTEKNRAFLFGDFHTYLINQNYVVVCSSRQDFETLTRPIYAAGLSFNKAESIEFNVVEKTLDGIYVLENIGTNDVKFKWVDDFDDGYESYGGYNNGKGSYQTSITDGGAWNDGTDDNYTEADIQAAKDARIGQNGFCSLHDRQDIDEQGSYTTIFDEDWGWYDADSNFHMWDNITPEDWHNAVAAELEEQAQENQENIKAITESQNEKVADDKQKELAF